jgi:LAO/AO transport system kinase
VPRRLSLQAYFEGIRNRNSSVLGRAITLIESRRKDDQSMAEELLTRCMPFTGKAIRVGITGVPGVGKSTLMDRLGMQLIERGLSVAVLAVDPSSSRTGGSILGDKTRMEKLSVHPNAFVRPSPTDRHLGGVGRKTRETMLLCEASGFDVVLVESVGVGQSEIVLAGMVDCFVALMLPNAGDELQGIKKGLLEWVDILAVNKSDGKNAVVANRSRLEYQSALHYVPHRHSNWVPKTLCVSGLKGEGLEDLWSGVEEHREMLLQSGSLEKLRTEQRLEWLNSVLRDQLWEQFCSHSGVKASFQTVEDSISHGDLAVRQGASTLLNLFLDSNP